MSTSDSNDHVMTDGPGINQVRQRPDRSTSNDANKPAAKRSAYFRINENKGLKRVTNYKPPPKIQRSDANYDVANIKAELDDDGNPKDPIAILEQYSQYVKFLNDESVEDNIEVKAN